MSAAQITALIVAFVLSGAIAGSLVQLRPDSDPERVIRAIDNNAAYVLALREDAP